MRRILLPALFCLIITSIHAQTRSIVYFDFDKWSLTPQAKTTLDDLTAKPVSSIALYGHTDQLGSDAYNQALSIKRAEAVKNYLLQKGIDAGKISMVKGYGESQPAIDKLDAESRSENRRVTIEQVHADEEPAEPGDAEPVGEPQASTTPARPKTKEQLIKEIKDTATKAGDKIVLENINFYGGRHIFLPQSYNALYDLLETMMAIPTLEIEIQGHICCQPGDADGLDLDTGEPFLSVNRAREVYNYLVRRGIDKSRLRYRGFGHKYPIIPEEKTEAEKTINRRVEIKIVKK